MGPGKARIDEFSHVEVSGIRGWSDYWAPGGPTATPSPGPAPPRPSQDPGGRGAGVACGRRGGGVGGQPGRRHGQPHRRRHRATRRCGHRQAGRPCPRRLRGWSDAFGAGQPRRRGVGGQHRCDGRADRSPHQPARPSHRARPVPDRGAGRRRRVAARVAVGGRPFAVAGSDAGVFVTDQDAAVITRIDPATNRLAARIPIPAYGAIAVGAGAAWAANDQASTVYRIDPHDASRYCSARSSSWRTARAGACTPNGWPTSSACTPDLQRLGMLGGAAWRAMRLVVDTGLHARGWSRTRALAFALAHTPMPESFMGAEIDRYIAMPGQALGYLVGQREILRLRDYTRARLGAAWDIRDFHAAILDHGSLPLPVLLQVVEAWVTSATAA